MKTIKLSQSQWQTILGELHQTYPKSTFMIRDRMKAKLGFTPRNHKGYHPRGYFFEQVHLDFFSENKYTMFILKFSEQINNEDHSLELI